MKSASISLLSFLLLAKGGCSASWDYDDMVWQKLSDKWSMCGAQDESPIDVNTLTATRDSSVCVARFDWDINLKHDTFKVVNNGHTIALKPAESVDTSDPTFSYSAGSTFKDSKGTVYKTVASNEETIAKMPNYFLPEGSEHDTFCLDSMHFHWGLDDESGSEHTVNGYQFPLELHFVHYSCNHDSLGTMLGNFGTEKDVLDGILDGEDTHQLAVVGLFFDVVEDKTNPAFDALFDDALFSDIQYPAKDGDSEHDKVVKGMDLTELIPADIGSAGYYAYEGSLTTPPCTNIVRWHVMNSRSYIGRDQMEKFRDLMMDSNNTVAPNFRDIQNNVNPVYACLDSGDLKRSSSETEETLTAGWIVAIIAIIFVVILGVLAVYQECKVQSLQSRVNNDTEKRDRVMSISNDVAMGSLGYQSKDNSKKVTNA